MPTIDPQQSWRRVRRWLWIAAGSVAAIGLGALAWSASQKPPVGAADAAASYASAIGGPFTSTDTNGKAFSSAQLKGKPFAIFFGFTRCPDVCPTTLSRMAQLRKQLGADRDKFSIVFVTVDPQRDTPAEMANYVGLFGTPIIGLSGTSAQTAQAVKAYHVFYAKVPTGPGDYTIDHTATIFLMDAKGGFSGTIAHDEAQNVALEKLKNLIDRKSVV